MLDHSQYNGKDVSIRSATA